MLPIVGLYSDYTNKVEISAYQGGSTVVEIQTPDVYNGVKPVFSMETTPEYLQDNIILVLSLIHILNRQRNQTQIPRIRRKS